VSYLNNKKIELEESDFEQKNVKKTLLKITKHYHSDKKDLLPGVFTIKDKFLREIILRIITGFIGADKAKP
jgi:hypothetical protein